MMNGIRNANGFVTDPPAWVITPPPQTPPLLSNGISRPGEVSCSRTQNGCGLVIPRMFHKPPISPRIASPASKMSCSNGTSSEEEEDEMNGQNPVQPRAVPSWQKPITYFYPILNGGTRSQSNYSPTDTTIDITGTTSEESELTYSSLTGSNTGSETTTSTSSSSISQSISINTFDTSSVETAPGIDTSLMEAILTDLGIDMATRGFRTPTKDMESEGSNKGNKPVSALAGYKKRKQREPSETESSGSSENGKRVKRDDDMEYY